MGILVTLYSRMFKAEPFTSEALDNLAETMDVTKILKRNKLDRYYKSRFLMQGGGASFDRVVFDAVYLEMLLPDELLAVASHEFTHLNQRHGRKRVWRLLMPALLVGAITTIFLGFYGLEDYFSSILTGGIVTFVGMVALAFLYAKWQRQQEIECDLSSLKIDKGPAMVSALLKISSLRPKGDMEIKLAKFIPQTYPTFEQRINNIQQQLQLQKIKC